MFKQSLAALLLSTCFSTMAAEYSVIRQYVHPVIVGSTSPTTKTQIITGSGSAVVLAPKYLITAAHVIPTSSTSDVYVRIGDTLVRATPIKIDRKRDLALLSANVTCPCAALNTKTLRLDDPVYTVGFPLYMTYGIQFVTSGTIQGMFGGDFVTTSTTAPGGSGGGVFIQDGKKLKLTGITVAIASSPLGPRLLQLEQEHNWITFNVTIGTVREFLRGTPLAPY